MPAFHQGPRRHAYCRIEIEGVGDVTDKLLPFLISVQVIDKLGFENDNCAIELDDRDAKLALPQIGQGVKVRLGWDSVGPRIGPVPTPMPAGSERELPFGGSGTFLLFDGFITSVESGGARSRGGGRRLWIDADSMDPFTNAKEPHEQNWGAGSEQDDSSGGGGDQMLSSVFGDAAKAAGLSGTVSPSLANKARDYWHQNESFMHFGQRLAQEMGGFFKIQGGNATLVSGADLGGDVQAWWGINLIAWRLKPYISRPQFASSSNKFFDIAKGAWDSVVGQIGGSLPFGGATAMAQLPGSAPNRQVGEQNNGGVQEDSEGARATGWILMNGEPTARAGMFVNLVGARPGVDGKWRIAEAEHNYSRRGYDTRVNCDRLDVDPQAYRDMGWTEGQPAPLGEPVPVPQSRPPLPDVVIEGLDIL